MTGRLEGPEQRKESSRRLRALPTNMKTWDFILKGAQEGWEQEYLTISNILQVNLYRNT